MAAHFVHCRTCKLKFDAKVEEENIEWVRPSKNFYYHKKCYEEWKASDNKSDDDWVLMIYDFIARDLKGAYNWQMIEAQRTKFVAQRMTNKGIYYSLYWYFITKNSKWREEYGIGIVPSIYKEATSYWTDRESKKAGIVEQIEKLAREKMEADPIKIAPTTSRKKKQIKAPE